MTDTLSNENFIGASKEVIYAQHIFGVLNKATCCFESKDAEQFALYVTYLEAATLNKKVREDIKLERDKVFKELTEIQKKRGREHMSDITINFNVAFVTITHVMAYINSILDLDTVDIASSVDSDFTLVSKE
jgi:hypothetical protein